VAAAGGAMAPLFIAQGSTRSAKKRPAAIRPMSPLGFLLVVNFATIALGQSLSEEGKFSISNIAPMVFCAMASLVYVARTGGRVKLSALIAFIAFNVCALVSFAIYMVYVDWVPNILVLGFQDSEILFCLLLVWYARGDPREFRSAVRFGIYMSMIVMAWSAWRALNTVIPERPWWYLGMDDRSHTAIILSCEAYILIRFYGAKLDCLVALGLLIVSFVTTSRLPVLLIPAIGVALVRSSRFGKFIAVAAVSGAVIAIAGFWTLIASTFTVLQRLASVDTVTGEGSTQVHVLLLKSALASKFASPLSFFFGIGPGNFSKALLTDQFFLSDIRAIDPPIYENALMGQTPVHSTPVSLFLDYNVLVFIAILIMVLKILRYLVRTRDFVGLLFALGFLTAATFYSLHNKPHFFLLLSTIFAFTVIGHKERALQAESMQAQPLPASI
jgi:hypothetical protein